MQQIQVNSKKIDTDPKSMQQINLTLNLERDGITKMFFIIQEIKETVQNFSKRTVRVLRFYFVSM